MTKKNVSLRIANAVAFVATVAVNFLAVTLPLGGISTGQISDMYPTLFTPAAFTFSIWAAIYIMVGIFVAAQLFSKNMKEVDDIGIFFILSCVFNIMWIFAWHNQMITLSTIAIIALLGTLMKIYFSTRDSAVIPKAAFSIYYAWITVASMIAVFVLIKTLTGNAPVTPIEPRGKMQYPGDFTNIIIVGNSGIVSYVTIFEYAMATLAIIITTLITIWHIRKKKDYLYVITILWALGGILIKQLMAPVKPVIMLIVGIIAVGVLLFEIFRLMNINCAECNKRKFRQEKVRQSDIASV